GDVDTLLLDKTGTITFGNRLAAEIRPVGGASLVDALIAARLSSVHDDTPEGKSILALAEQLGAPSSDGLGPDAELARSTAETRMSGLAQDGHASFKGAVAGVVAAALGPAPADLERQAERISREGGTPLALLLDARIVGVVYLKDTVKPGMRERFDE